MQQGEIINLRELLQQRGGRSYRGDVAVFGLDCDSHPITALRDGGVYVNAFSYILVVGGAATFSVDGVDYAVERSTLCIFSPLHLTRLHGESHDFRCMIFGVTKRFIDKLSIKNIQHRIIRGMNMYQLPIVRLADEESAVVADCIRDIARQLSREGHRYHLEMIRNALERFNIETDNILDNYGDAATDGSGAMLSRQVVVLRQFVGLLLENYKVKHGVQFYAEKVNLSSQQLTNIIKRQTGRTVSDFIDEMLYCEARNLLDVPGVSVQQVAYELEYSDQASFSKAFKRLSGMSPQQFRSRVV